MLNQAEIFTEAIKEANKDVQMTNDERRLPEMDCLDTCFKQLCSAFDLRFGGFGKEPKFPHPSNVDFQNRMQC